MIAPIAIAIFFSAYLFFDSMAILARVSAASIGKNAFGASMEKMMSTLKRLMIFSYPPILGYLIVIGDQASIFRAIFLSYAFGSTLVILVYLLRQIFYKYFLAVANSFDAGQGALTSLVRSLYRRPAVVSRREWQFKQSTFRVAINRNIGLLSFASWIFFVHGGAIFFINILSMKFVTYSPIILQSLGIINGFGTLVMAFLVDPIVSRFLDRRKKLDEVAQVILGAQLIANCTLGPMFFWLIYLN